MSILHKPCLIISASYEPLAIIKARRAITLMVKEAAFLEQGYGREVYPGIELPSVIRLRQYKHIPVRVSVLTRKNILSRDRNICQYCGQKFPPKELTLDHVFPRSRGGKNSWDNLVTCCQKCNFIKDDRTPEEAGMKLLHKPRLLTVHTSRFLLRQIGMEQDTQWHQYLYA